ncbi:hypothetical protein [Rhizorhabdus dicambivorans]|uniref:Uncharacterized protein n=1 Tax=Rhizorhabdus dicambivorans TaxID=1850238 RepID=A0A2A4FYT9_9SPHN|nr:hypothetical protein [Rhizorhabdus dicambivorans]ATE66562.1 hypothetical protein CMV14_20875 [Rhizorhabdus dicambivorans]PCE43954.1 hypothetical protein COO09_03275 [Rhizorhabdus dicambivorans]
MSTETFHGAIFGMLALGVAPDRSDPGGAQPHHEIILTPEPDDSGFQSEVEGRLAKLPDLRSAARQRFSNQGCFCW